VRLWKKYERGNDDALELLIKYNGEDVENLEKLIEMTYPRMVEMEMKLKACPDIRRRL